MIVGSSSHEGERKKQLRLAITVSVSGTHDSLEMRVDPTAKEKTIPFKQKEKISICKSEVYLAKEKTKDERWMTPIWAISHFPLPSSHFLSLFIIFEFPTQPF